MEKYYRMTGEIMIDETFATDKEIDKDRIRKRLENALEATFDNIMSDLGLEGQEMHGILIDDIDIEIEED